MDWKKEKLRSIWKMNKEKLIFLFCSGLLLFILSIPNGDGKEKSETVSVGNTKIQNIDIKEDTASDLYEKELETRIREILKGVDGVGEVDVMVVLKSSEEKVIHVDQNSSSSTTEEKGEGGTSRIIKQQELSESTVMGSQSQEPVIEKKIKPEVAGIVISADGGGSAVVKAEISEAMEALFGLPAHKIKVLKRVKKGV